MKHPYTSFVLRTSDAPDAGATGAAEEVDPLSVAAGGVDTSYPTLMGDRIVRFEIASAKVDDVKDKPGRQQLIVKMKTTKDAVMSDGKTAKPGFVGIKRIGVTAYEETIDGEGKTSPGRDFDAIKRDLATLCQAINQKDLNLRVLLNNPAQIEGQVVDCRVGLQKAKGSFPESNSFTFVIPA